MTRINVNAADEFGRRGAGARRKRILPHLPIRPAFDEVGPENAAQRHEGHALLARLQRGVHRRAGAVAHHDLVVFDCCGEARRETGFAERDRARFDLGYAAGADQQVRAQAEDRHAQQTQIARVPSNQTSNHFHRGKRVVRRQREQRAVRNQRCQFFSPFRQPSALRS
jgi:hypothetical protein